MQRTIIQAHSLDSLDFKSLRHVKLPHLAFIPEGKHDIENKPRTGSKYE
jgi:hypothetical protein